MPHFISHVLCCKISVIVKISPKNWHVSISRMKSGVRSAPNEHSVNILWGMSPRAQSTGAIVPQSPEDRAIIMNLEARWGVEGGVRTLNFPPTRIRVWMGAELLLCPWKIIPCSEQGADKTKLVWNEQVQHWDDFLTVLNGSRWFEREINTITKMVCSEPGSGLMPNSHSTKNRRNILTTKIN